MWNENAGNEWRPKLECARLQLRLKEHARESIIFRESWPGERFQDFNYCSLEREYNVDKHIIKQKLRISLLLVLDFSGNKFSMYLRFSPLLIIYFTSS